MLMLMCGGIESWQDNYNIEELHKLCKQRGLVFVHQNIRRLPSNFERLWALVDSHQTLTL